jgi:hypothetical protein
MTLGALLYAKDNSKSHFEGNLILLSRRFIHLRGIYFLIMTFRTSYRIYMCYPGRGLSSFKQTLTFSGPNLRFIAYWEFSTSLAANFSGTRRK